LSGAAVGPAGGPGVDRLRTIPVHEVVRRTFPRPPPEDKDHVAMAVGRTIDGTLAQFGHEYRVGRRPTATAMRRFGTTLLEESLREEAVEVSTAERTRILEELDGVLQAYRRSPLVVSHTVNRRVGVGNSSGSSSEGIAIRAPTRESEPSLGRCTSHWIGQSLWA
jgi:hypothetical protein